MSTSLTILSVLMITAATWDVWQRRIPNPLILAGLLLGAALGFQEGGLAGPGQSLLGAAVALLALILPFVTRHMGGGDVKMMMVAGAFLGWSLVLQAIIVGTAIHGVLALAFLFAHRAARATGRELPKAAQVPHAVGFAIATLSVAFGLFRLW
jgi:Flp pilus assembly protein protease CpaA